MIPVLKPSNITAMENPYKKHLSKFFNRLIELRHIVYRVSNLLNRSIKSYETAKEDRIIAGSSLIISDITGPTDRGWTINFHTGATKATFVKSYKSEVEKTISMEAGYAFAQSYEAVESLLKDLVYQKTQLDPDLLPRISKLLKNGNDRAKYPGGDQLFKMIKIASGTYFAEYSNTNNYNLRFQYFWSVLSDARHAVTHSQSIIKRRLVFKSDIHSAIFEHFFPYNEVNEEEIEIVLDYKKLERLLKSVAEFGFQIYKILSIQNNYKWRIPD